MSEPAGAGAPSPALIVVELQGEPRGKATLRHRIVTPKDGPAFATGYPDAKTRQYETLLGYAARSAMRGRQLLTGPVVVNAFAYFSVPKSWAKWMRAQALKGLIRPTGKPDWDNIGKVLDAFKGVVWADDAPVIDGRVRKYYSARPALFVEVRAWIPGSDE
jgi:Holliday junction resolvase RusA-like endonuclease